MLHLRVAGILWNTKYASRDLDTIKFKTWYVQEAMSPNAEGNTLKNDKNIFPYGKMKKKMSVK